MFWIPICFIVCVIWGIRLGAATVKENNDRAAKEERDARCDRFRAQYCDRDLEEVLNKKLFHIEDRVKVICDLMGYTDDWAAFARKDRDAALLVELAKAGKVHWLTAVGSHGMLARWLFNQPDKNIQYNIRFLKALEALMRNNGILTSIVVYCTDGTYKSVYDIASDYSKVNPGSFCFSYSDTVI